ncbi:MAG TPA: c-type cytochrome [Candidatus Baltobacteraceae bacterium]|jgi:mono/diheme cytochrome c family protein
MPRFVVVVSALLTVAALCACGSHTATAGPGAAVTATPLESASVGRGRAVFAARCATCHGAAGEGAQIGPPLRGELRRRTPAFVTDAIANPSPPMPKLVPAQMSQQDLLDVTAFVEQL